MKTWCWTALCAVLLHAFVFSAAAGESMSLRVVSRSLSPTQPGWYNALYVEASGPKLRSDDQVSADNGRTWQSKPMRPDYAAGLPYGYRREFVMSALDPITGRLISLFNSLDTPGLDPKAHEPPIAQQTYYLRYRVSGDHGQTWAFDEPIMQGAPYTPQHPFDGLWVGTNAVYIGDLGSIPITTRTGKVLVPAQMTPLGSDGKLLNPMGGLTYTDALVLIGTWTNGQRLAWQASTHVAGDPKLTARGLIEPTLAELPDGRILMVMRGSNGGKADPRYALPSYKWFALSKDGGYTWSKPLPWAFEDGKPFFSPSSMSALFRHSTGRYFWSGNLCETNCQGNRPRWPVVVAEVDLKTLGLKRSSLLMVDTLQPEDSSRSRVDISHMTMLEDRENRQIVLAYPRAYNGYKSREWATVRLGLK